MVTDREKRRKERVAAMQLDCVLSAANALVDDANRHELCIALIETAHELSGQLLESLDRSDAGGVGLEVAA